MTEKNLTLTLSRSPIGECRRVRNTLQALGLGRLGSSVVRGSHPAILGMIGRVQHLLKVEES